MPAGEAYDVVVVRDPTMTVGAIMALSRDLAHLTGVKQADVELALQKGRFIVYPRLPSARVDAAAEQLRTMGAVVQVRPAEDTGPIDLEPDRDRPHVDAFDGPVAHFSDIDLNLDSGAFNTGAGVISTGSSYNEGIGRVLPLEDARTSRYQPVPRSSPNSQMSLTDEDMRALVLGLERRKPAAPADDMQALADGLDAAAFDSPEIQTIDGMDGAAFDAAEEAAQKEAVPATTAPPSPHEPEDELALDAPAPSGPPPERSLQLDRPHQSSTSLSSSSMQQSSTSQSSMSQPAMSYPAYAGARAVPRPNMQDLEVPTDRGLLFEDSVANILAMVALCTLLTTVIAFGVTNATKRSEVADLEEEISESYRNPLEVEFGERRAPAVLEEELQKVYDSARTRFLLVFVLGIPLGLGLGQIRR